MAINLSTKTDYSFLFSGLGTSSTTGVGSSNFLADYASIKNGSYGKLMKAYYGNASIADKLMNQKKTTTNTSTSKDSSETLTKVISSTDSLKDSADALLTQGEDSLFAEKDITTKNEDGTTTTTKGYDKDAIYDAVNKFVSDFNSVVKSTGDSNTNSIANRSKTLITTATANSKQLSKIGISINEDYTLSIDKDAFKKADMGTVKSMFNESGSFGYRVSAQASLINFAADTEASKANTYNLNGTYNSTYSNGNLFNSYL